MAVAYLIKFQCLSPARLLGFSITLPSFIPAFSFVFPSNLSSALSQAQDIFLYSLMVITANREDSHMKNAHGR